MRTRKILAGVLAALTVALLLAGCGQSKPTSPSPSTTPSTTPAPAPAKEPVSLVVWSHLQQNEVDEVQKIAQQWAQKTGNKVEVLFDATDFQAYATAAQAGKGPDIMYGIAHDTLGSFQKAGLLSEAPSGIINKDDYPQVSIDAVSYGGKMYAVPIGIESIALMYNKALVPQAPKTWDEFMKAAKDKGFAYDVTNFYFSWGFLAGNGGYVFKNTGGGLDAKDVGLASEGSKAGLKLVSDLVNTYKFMPVDITGDVAKSQFVSGKTGMYLSGPWDVKAIQDAKIDFGVAPMPTLPNGKPFVPFIGVYAAFVNSGSKHQAEAWDLIKYLRENDPAILFKIGSRYPANKKFQDMPEVKSNAIAAGFGQSALNGVPMPNIPAMSQVWDPTKKMLEMVVQGTASIDKATSDAVKTINDAVAAMK